MSLILVVHSVYYVSSFVKTKALNNLNSFTRLFEFVGYDAADEMGCRAPQGTHQFIQLLLLYKREPSKVKDRK